MEKVRIIFPKGLQQEFVKKCKCQSNLTWKELAKRLGVHPTTLKRSIHYEVCSLPNKLFVKMCKIMGTDSNKVLKDNGAKRIYYKPNLNFPDNFGRKKNTLPTELVLTEKIKPAHLNSCGVQNSYNDVKRGVKLPMRLLPLLAEEIGIHIGDGHLSEKRNRYKLFGNQNESDYYVNFIKKLYKKLYNLDVKITKRADNTIGFEISSRMLWLFKTKIIGLPCGRKDDIIVPRLIMGSHTDCLKSFIRGIFDTDGNIHFQSRYGYKKYYPRLEITSKSYTLCKNTQKILECLGFKAKTFKGNCAFGVVMYGYENLMRYANKIGWHNIKHELKFKEWKQKHPKLSGRASVFG